ncbi:MAG: transposase [Acidimicrobiia bacterium]|nr:transposase [Acidimicrobiia bacterium]
MLWSGHRFRTTPTDLAALWARLPADATEVMVVMEPTRNARVPLAAWFRRQGAVVVMVPSEQSADLRDYFSKHTKTDRLDAQLLARLPVLHPEGLHPLEALGPGDPLKRAVKIRAGLVHRRSTAMHRLDSLLEILGPGWVEALGSDMTQTAFRFFGHLRQPPSGETSRPATVDPLVPTSHPQGVGIRASRPRRRRCRGNAGAMGPRRS